MSSAPSPPNPGSAPATSTAPAPSENQIIIYRHSNLFYWWPVWAIGGLFAIITVIHNQHLAIVPSGTVAVQQREVDIDGTGKFESRDVLILNAKKKLWTKKNEAGESVPVQPVIFVTHYRIFGSIYAFVLLLIITLTNIPIRGLWSVVVILVLIMLGIILSISGWATVFLHQLNQLSIYINLGGYILISSVLFVLWSVNFFLFDRQTYMLFTPGQLRVRFEIGGEETVYDTAGLVVQRERGDLFRHWVLGFGSGDLIIKPFGRTNPLVFPNVLRVESAIAKIEQMVKQKIVVNTSA